MTGVAFNAFTAVPQGVFSPMVATERLDVKLAESSANARHHFNHINRDSSETYVILSGDYQLRVGEAGKGSRITAKTGDVFVVPKGVPHGDVSTEQGYRLLLLETPIRNSVLAKLSQLKQRLWG